MRAANKMAKSLFQQVSYPALGLGAEQFSTMHGPLLAIRQTPTVNFLVSLHQNQTNADNTLRAQGTSFALRFCMLY